MQLHGLPLNTMTLMIHPISVRASMLALTAAVAAILGGCGGGTKTVSVASSPTTAHTTSTTQPTTSTATTPANTTTTSTTSGGTSTPSTTRTATAPAFAEREKSSGSTPEGLGVALAVVRAHGYVSSDTSDYHSNQTLRVLIGTNAGSGDGYSQQAFFFVDGRYIGTDSSRPSAQVKVVAQSDTEVTLAYALYRPGNPLCCPGGGQAQVRFQLNNGQLAPLDPLPPVNSTTGLSRQ
jgi:hypothetical protein